MIASHVDGEDGRAALVACAVHNHRDRRVVVFEAGQVVFPKLARAGVAVVELVGEFEVELCYGGGQNGGAGAITDGHQLERSR